MAKRKETKPVDFKFLKKFDFVADVGNYTDKQVCIMSAAALAVSIAEGKTALDVLKLPQCPVADDFRDENGEIDWDKFDRARDKWHAKAEALGLPPETDELSCVDPTLRNLLIQRNDELIDDEDRKKWALKMLPRILGTKGTAAQQRKAAEAAYAAVDGLRFKQAKWLAEEFIRTKDGNLLFEARSWMEGHNDPDGLALLDLQIEAVLAVVERKPKATKKKKAKKAN